MVTPLLDNLAWAVDTLESEGFHRNARYIIGSLSRASAMKVYPIHILNYPFATPIQIRDFEDAYLALAEKQLRSLAEKADIPGMQPGTIVVNRTGSVRAAVELLLDCADAKGADAIVTSTHSRGRIERFFLGSFAESLLVQSMTPVISVNPVAKVREKIAKVLFPTSFEEHFRGAFHEAVRLCSILDAKLTVFYKEPYIPYLPLLLKDSPTLYRMIDAKAKERVLEIDRCRAWARDHLVEIEIETDDEPGDVADAISLFAAENNFDLIVMTSETSDFEGPRAGNVCRKVVRTAECPVWTFKPDEMNGNDETAN